jgi:hypothetical protein
MPEIREGHCTCGAVRYRLQGAPMFVHCCHCTDCQRKTGSGFALNAIYEMDRVELLAGEPEPIDTPSASGKGQVILRCPACKVALWSHYAGSGEAVGFVRVGTLEEAASLTPDIHVYTRSKLSWVRLPDGVPAVEGYYRPKDVWPPESRARWLAAMG